MGVAALEVSISLWVQIGQLLLFGALMIAIPRFTRRGLLFGAYVGEDAAAGDEARCVARGWYRSMAVALLVSIGLGLLLRAWPQKAIMFMWACLTAGFFVSYLRAHLAARKLAPAAPPPPAVAALESQAPTVTLPLLVLFAGLVGGLFAIGYAWWHYDALPERLPIHFNAKGGPDGWARKSVLSAMLMPSLTLLLGVGMGVLTWFVARAKRALRADKEGVSLSAQLRFRRAMTRFLAVIALCTTAMLAVGSIGAVDVASGSAQRLPPLFTVLAVGMAAYCIVGVIYIAVRYGQGGARLEKRVAGAPLSDGLADNTKWKLGLLYVNRDDPSIFVEHRFGLGYTINLGNPTAVAIVGGFVALTLLMALASRYIT